MPKRIDPSEITCPVPVRQYDTIQLSHGSGGLLSQKLIETIIKPAFDNRYLDQLDDHAVLKLEGKKIAFSTDSYVVDPIFFPGGDIGKLAVHGTVNDLSTGGARPLYLSIGFIIEEGWPMADLRKIVGSIKEAADEAEVVVVTGDTKVVNRGKGDKLFINSSGVALLEHEFNIHGTNLHQNDAVLVTGTLADHGITILSARNELSLENDVVSDTAPLNHLVADIVGKFGGDIHAMRDPTRGGVAATLNEMAKGSGCSIELLEESLPIAPAVRSACEILGLDPLYIANEGKMLIVVDQSVAEQVLQAVKKNRYGNNAAIIGHVSADGMGRVSIKTSLGTERIVDMPVGEQLPRIC